MNNSDDCSIQKKETLHIFDQQNDDVIRQVFFKTLTGKTVTLDVSMNDTIGAIKLKFSKKEGVPPHSIRAICAGRQLQDDKTLESYGYDPEKISWHIKFQSPGNTDELSGIQAKKCLDYCIPMIISTGIACVGVGLILDSKMSCQFQVHKELVHGSIICGVGVFFTALTLIFCYKSGGRSDIDDRVDTSSDDNSLELGEHL